MILNKKNYVVLGGEIGEDTFFGEYVHQNDTVSNLTKPKGHQIRSCEYNFENFSKTLDNYSFLISSVTKEQLQMPLVMKGAKQIAFRGGD